jgi:hypothetical protein
MLDELRLADWYWFALAVWCVLFLSLTGVLSVGFRVNPFPLLWTLLSGWPQNDYFSAIFRPLRWLAPLPVILLPLAVRRSSDVR